MARYSDESEEPIRKRSGWLIPLVVFLITFALSAAVLAYYLAPRPSRFTGEQPSPTVRTDLVDLRVHNLKLAIPANFLVSESVRQGGDRIDVPMFARLPELHGFRSGEAAEFSDNAADSDVVYLLMREEKLNFTEADRLKRIYLNLVADPRGSEGPFGLTQYVFRDDTGYRGEDLFVGETDHGAVVMTCVRFSQDVASPSCLRDLPVAHGVTLTYRFKRAHLSHWRDIDHGIKKLIASFVVKPKATP